MFKFRPVTAADFPLMLRWLSKPHVKEWWDDSDDTLEKVASHYGADDETARFILLETESGLEKPIGYFQYYAAGEGVIGIDQFIGEESCINRGIGTKAIKEFVRLIVERHDPPEIILDPSPGNKRAIRCYEKAGFRYFETREIENDQTVYMMRLELQRPVK